MQEKMGYSWHRPRPSQYCTAEFCGVRIGPGDAQRIAGRCGEPELDDDPMGVKCVAWPVNFAASTDCFSVSRGIAVG